MFTRLLSKRENLSSILTSDLTLLNRVPGDGGGVDLALLFVLADGAASPAQTEAYPLVLAHLEKVWAAIQQFRR